MLLRAEKLPLHSWRSVLLISEVAGLSRVSHFVQVMRRSFNHWHRLLVHLHVAGGRAAATSDWKATLRAWREWKMATEEKRREKVADVTSTVQHELRLAFGGGRSRMEF